MCQKEEESQGRLCWVILHWRWRGWKREAIAGQEGLLVPLYLRGLSMTLSRICDSSGEDPQVSLPLAQVPKNERPARQGEEACSV